jgi:hypothetical protein
MFFKKSHSANEIEASVLEALPAKNEEVGIEVALQSLADSAEIFESMNLPEEAEIITQFMETIASGQFAMVKEAKKKAKKKSKTKSKTKTKSKSKSTTKKKPSTLIDVIKDVTSEVLTPEKQIDNLENIGWVFNAPKSDCGECNMADDGPKSGVMNNKGQGFGDEVASWFGLGKLPTDDNYHGPESGVREKRQEDGFWDICPECGYDHMLESDMAQAAECPRLHKVDALEESNTGGEPTLRSF